MNRTTGLALLLGIVLGASLGYAAARHLADAPLDADRAAGSVEEILNDPDPMRRAIELPGVLARSGPEALDGIVAAFDAAPLDSGDPALVHFVAWWARFDPEATLRWVQRDWRADDAAVLRALFRHWGHRDPQKAWGVAQALPIARQRSFCADAAIVGWDESGKPGLVEFVRNLHKGWAQQSTAEILARRKVVSLGSEQAFAWAESLPNREFREIMVPRVASAVTMSDPATAAAWAEAEIAKARRPTGLPRRIATRWLHRDPEAAMAWLATLPEGADRADGVTETFRDWMKQDRGGARRWIESTPLEPWNEPAFGVYVRGPLSQRDPAHALKIVSEMSDETLRNYLTTVIARNWLKRDFETADAWMKQADLPEEVRARAYMLPNPVPPKERAKQRQQAS